ncbi:MAG TPA: metal-dependent hydrolase [Candidatus Saccharimonadales bacterium]|nr:metal-dependent hydrolase [Candidatus Saccharimonadales bacterium]
MPSYKVHLVGGLLTYLGILHIIKHTDPTIHTIVQGLLFCLLGALFPDIDVKSKGQKVFYTLLLFFLLYLVAVKKYCLFVCVSFLGLIPILVRHRGLFHHIWFLLVMALVATLGVKMMCGSYEQMMIHNCWFFFAGSVSHVVLDRVCSRLKRYFS